MRIPYVREHTGTRQGDGMQRTAQQAARQVGSVDARVSQLEGEVRGTLPLVLVDADRALTTAEAAHVHFTVSGTLTAARTLRLPDETDATARVVWVSNVTSGGFALTIATNDGTASVANGTTRALIIRGAGPATLV